MSFGSNIQFMRKMHNDMTQEELSEKMNVSRQTISKWETDNTYPEMDKAFILSKLFNCSLDELFKDDLDSGSKAYHNIRIEEVKKFNYVSYVVISEEPEDDANLHILNWAKSVGLKDPEIIGWDFPMISQEQRNVYRMHGYCCACRIPEDYINNEMIFQTQMDARYVVITIENPFYAPFSLIPNAYKTLYRYIEVNGLKVNESRDVLECFEKVYDVNGITFMDVYIAID